MADERRAPSTLLSAMRDRYGGETPPTPSLADALRPYQPPPTDNTLSALLHRYGVQPFSDYLERQGALAKYGLDQANRGAEQVRAGDPFGLANMLLGPAGYLSSPINALLPAPDDVYNASRDLNLSPEAASVAGGLVGAMSLGLPGPKGIGAARQSPLRGLAQNLKTVMDSSPYQYHGIRVTERPLSVGDEAPASRVWTDGAPTENMLSGPSTILVKNGSVDEIEKALGRAQLYYGDNISLIGAHNSEWGEDAYEAILPKGRTLATAQFGRDH